MPAGLTGWAQVHGLNGDTSIHDRVRLDNSYIENWSFWLDLTILARTVASTVVTAAASLAGASRTAPGSGGTAPARPLAGRSLSQEPALAHSELGAADSEPAFSRSTRGGSR
jgi:hypothetical protein